ncbi:MAG: hypothetical protein HY459_00405 [Parcubacteria group bacterium]|nr:hypothetical protein [Parcubacteria group bacterium]
MKRRPRTKRSPRPFKVSALRHRNYHHCIMGGETFLLLDEVQLAGKNRMSTQDFLRGAPGMLGSVLG